LNRNKDPKKEKSFEFCPPTSDGASDSNNPSKKPNWDAHFNETKNLINSWSRK